jgi:hypothetical protein
VDAQDALTKLLEPGERIIWSDHPRGFARAFRRRLTFSFFATLFVAALPDLLLLAVFHFASKGFTRVSTQDWLTMTQALGLGALPALALIAFNVWVATRSLHRIFAVTDRQRALVVDGRRTKAFPLPKRAVIVTRERFARVGDIEVGDVRFEDIADPHAAVETIRGVAP